MESLRQRIRVSNRIEVLCLISFLILPLVLFGLFSFGYTVYDIASMGASFQHKMAFHACEVVGDFYESEGRWPDSWDDLDRFAHDFYEEERSYGSDYKKQPSESFADQVSVNFEHFPSDLGQAIRTEGCLRYDFTDSEPYQRLLALAKEEPLPSEDPPRGG